MNSPAQEQKTSGQADVLATAKPQVARQPSTHPRIVVDASGGDAPLRERVAGALQAAHIYGDIEVLLCGAQQDIEREISELGGGPGNIELIDAPEPIGMHEPPIKALREKKKSSIVVGVELIARGEADAFVSAGNTGAVAAASALKLGRLKGVQRPGIAVAMQAIDHPVVAIDVGANVDSKAVHLLQYGIMASVFAREVVGIENPRVGLLNVGKEDAKGNETVKQAFELLSSADLNFVGNAEPATLFAHGCDIMICDGFVGNVLLKMGESLMMRLIEWMREEVQHNLRYKLGFLLCKELFGHLRHCGDYTEYGGAPLLGVDGVTIITHGTSEARAIQNAVREARMFVELRVNDHIADAVQRDAASRGLRI